MGSFLKNYNTRTDVKRQIIDIVYHDRCADGITAAKFAFAANEHREFMENNKFNDTLSLLDGIYKQENRSYHNRVLSTCHSKQDKTNVDDFITVECRMYGNSYGSPPRHTNVSGYSPAGEVIFNDQEYLAIPSQSKFYDVQIQKPVTTSQNIYEKIIYILDFSFSKEYTEYLCDQYDKVVVLDHHPTAYERLSSITRDNFEFVYDENRSGAGITWDYFFKGYERPLLVNYIEDNDLWKHSLPNSKILANVLYDVVTKSTKITTLAAQFARDDIRSHWTTKATIIDEDRANIASAMANQARSVMVANRPMRAVVCPSALISYVAEKINSAVPALLISIGTNNISCSLRARTGNVKEVAEMFGGGGHVLAAGFSITYEQLNCLLVNNVLYP